MYEKIYEKTKATINTITANKKVPISAYNPMLLGLKLESYTGHKHTTEAASALLNYLKESKNIANKYGVAIGYDWDTQFDNLFLDNPEVEPSALLLMINDNLIIFTAEQEEKKAQAAAVSNVIATIQAANGPA